jgi:hypothetical protein
MIAAICILRYRPLIPFHYQLFSTSSIWLPRATNLRMPSSENRYGTNRTFVKRLWGDHKQGSGYMHAWNLGLRFAFAIKDFLATFSS